jgi:predicted secreted protein
MAVLNGTKMRVIVNGVAIGGTKSFTLDIKKNNPDASSKDSAGYKNRISGQKDWTVSFDGLYDPAGVYNFEQLFDMIDGDARVLLEMAVIDGTGGGELYKGYALGAGLSMGAAMEETVTISGNFEADGPIDKGTVATS